MFPSIPYPATPTGVSSSVTEPSPAFKKQVIRVFGVLLFFIFVYLFLVILALALAAACVFGGILIIQSITSAIGILLGVGVMGMGVMVFIFLIKFIFTTNRYDRTGQLEITESEQPDLFAFVRRLARETGTPFPKRIFLTPDVNAAVTYDSSFWSMFLPVKKNLLIGLGLVNALSLSEFKAVIAHEFGHFSQRSMKLGSFVYNFNKVMHNMLYENTGYSKTLSSFASFSGVFAFFAEVTVSIVRGIQSILQSLYGLVNKQYKGLSREMEFHADAVSASVSGSESLVTSLRRLDMAQSSYDEVLRHCDELLKGDKRLENLYTNQLMVLKEYARYFKLDLKGDSPVIPDSFLTGELKSRINFKDQWASHPLNSEREEQLRNLNIQAEVVDEPARILFRDWERYQQELTQKVYEGVAEANPVQWMNTQDFEKRYLEDVQLFSLPEAYRGYFNDRVIFDFEANELIPETEPRTFDDILGSEQIQLSKQLKQLNQDLQLARMLESGQVDTRSFDFDGVKYPILKAKEVGDILENERNTVIDRLKETDLQLIRHFLRKAGPDANQLRTRYLLYFESRKRADETLGNINKMLESLGPIFQGQTLENTVIMGLIYKHKDVFEKKFKTDLAYWQEKNVFESSETNLKEQVANFLQADWQYFSNGSYFENELIGLNNLCLTVWPAIQKANFIRFSDILKSQLISEGQ